MAFWAVKNSFNAGELSPKMFARTDVSQYDKGCQKLQNFKVTPYGAIERRGGFKYQYKSTADDAIVGNSRLIRFVFSREIVYVLWFTNKTLRIFQSDNRGEYLNLIPWNDGELFYGPSPYSADEVSQIKYVQSADVMTLVHPNHPVMELKRIEEKRFVLEEKKFEYPPMLDPDPDRKIHLALTYSDSIRRLSSSVALFTPDHVGAYFQLAIKRQENEISIDFKADGTSSSLEVFGHWTFTTHGTWTGQLSIQRSFDNGSSWEDYRVYSSAKDTNISTDGDETEEGVLYRLQMTEYAASTTGTLKLCRCLFVNPSQVKQSVVQITAVEDGKNAVVKGIKNVKYGVGTYEWCEGAWSYYRGFPAAVAFFEERMFFGGTTHKPNTVWGSKTNDWDNFLIGDKDDDGIEFTLASDTVNKIVWLSQQESLIIGTIDSEWTLSASSSDSALTPSNFRLRRQSVYGCADIQPQMLGEVVVFVQQGERKVREFVYSWEKDGYSAPDMTILAEHISDSGIKEIILQQLPDNTIYCLLNNGYIAAMVYEREQDVVGWYNIVTAGKILSVTSIPFMQSDMLVAVILRNNVCTIETIGPNHPYFLLDSYRHTYYLANGDNQDVPNMKVTVEGVPGFSYDFFVNYRYIGKIEMPENGIVEIPFESDDVIKEGSFKDTVLITCGIPFESVCVPEPIEINSSDVQTLFRRKNVGEIRLNYYDSIGGEICCGDGPWQKIISFDVKKDNLDTRITPKDGSTKVSVLSGYDESIQITIRQQDPYPLNITSIAVKYEVQE